MTEGKKIDRYLNLSGLLCPNPSLITAKKLEDMKSGEILEVVCSDKSVKVSIPDLCRQGNYELVETLNEKGLIHFIIRK
jgi:tRNA 2-thiouridine synthesizing protein A